MEGWRKFQIKNREIWDVELSYPGEGVGHEEKFKHPCVIIKFNKFVDMATIIPLTRRWGCFDTILSSDGSAFWSGYGIIQ